MNKTARPKDGIFLGLTFGFIVVLGTIFFFRKWLPDIASDRGELDRLFYFILILTGIAFVGVQGLTGYFIWRYSDPTPERAVYLKDSHTLEITWTVITTILMCVIGFWGLGLWKKVVTSTPPPNAIVVELTAQQFQWNVRYPGPDGVFGKTDPKLISDDNPLGLDPNDAASKDDVVTQDQLYLPVNVPVRVRLHSKDVIHSFYLPNFRVKQDVVPGMTIETWFTPTRVGEFDIACAQFCGLGHYKMGGKIEIVSLEDYNKKLKELKVGSMKPAKLFVGMKGD